MDKNKSLIIYRVAIVAILILLAACTVALVTFGIRGVRPELKQPTSEGNEELKSPAALKETADYGEGYVNSIIFLGDSTISHMREAGVLYEGESTTQIWTDSDGRLPLDAKTHKTELYLPASERTVYVTDAAAELKPDYLVITVGLENGVRYCTKAQFKDYYTSLVVAIKEASPTTHIILNSIFPVSKKYEKSTQGISRDKIDTANSWIIEIAEEQDVKYLNSAEALKNSGGYLDSKYDSGDGLHLNAEGYAAFFQYIRTHGYKSHAPKVEETESSTTESQETVSQ